MFGFFEKSVGVHIQDDQLIVVKLAKKAKVPKLSVLARQQLPEGTIEAGVLKNKVAFVEALKAVSSSISFTECNFSLPAGKVYSAVLKSPSKLKGDVLEHVVREKAAAVLPANFDELYVEKVMRAQGGTQAGAEGGVAIFLSAVERKVIADYSSAFAEAGSEGNFTRESLGLLRFLSMQVSGADNAIFVHALADSALIVCSSGGLIFDDMVADDIAGDFIGVYNAYFAQVGHGPKKVILSGDAAQLASIEKMKFKGAAPEIIYINSVFHLGGQEQPAGDSAVAAGLALAKIKSGHQLISLLD